MPEQQGEVPQRPPARGFQAPARTLLVGCTGYRGRRVAPSRDDTGRRLRRRRLRRSHPLHTGWKQRCSCPCSTCAAPCDAPTPCTELPSLGAAVFARLAIVATRCTTHAAAAHLCGHRRGVHKTQPERRPTSSRTSSPSTYFLIELQIYNTSFVSSVSMDPDLQLSVDGHRARIAA